MKLIRPHIPTPCTGLTMVEIVISMAIASLLVGAIMYGYVNATRNVEWAAYSLSAQSMALQRVEQVRAAMWDPDGVPFRDEATNSNFPVLIMQLDVPFKGTNYVWATNTTTISNISANPPFKSIYVECTWAYRRGSKYTKFTNSILTYRRPTS